MREEIATVLRLVAEGKLTAEEAAPLIEALSARPSRQADTHARHDHDAHSGVDAADATASGRSRRVRIQVSERGRRVVDLRVPLAFASFAARAVPGIPASYADMIEQAVETGGLGAIIDTEDESGDRVLITLE